MYHYTSCGLDNVYLTNGYEISEGLEGRGVSIHDLDELHEVIARCIVDSKRPLSGKEFRFLRIELDLTQKSLGELMGKSDQIVAKWEKGSPIPVLADKAIRDLYNEDHGGRSSTAEILKVLRQADSEIQECEFKLRETKDGWQHDCA